MARRIYAVVTAGSIFEPLGRTLYLLGVAYAIGCVLAIALGVLMGRFAPVHGLLEPLVEVLRPLPKPALLPPLMLFLGLGDTMKITAVALGAALEQCPASLLPPIERMARDPGRRSAHRVLAIRILARSRSPRALQSLTEIALPRRRWFLRRRLAPKFPELLAAVAGLASTWAGEPAAEPVLAQASRHTDPEVRAAASRDG